MRGVDARIVAVELQRPERGGIYLSDELLPGIEIDERLRRRPLPDATALPVIEKVHGRAVRHDAVELADAVPVVVLIEAGFGLVREIPGVVVGERVPVERGGSISWSQYRAKVRAIVGGVVRVVGPRGEGPTTDRGAMLAILAMRVRHAYEAVGGQRIRVRSEATGGIIAKEAASDISNLRPRESGNCTARLHSALANRTPQSLPTP